jgi:ATP-dependent Zn protease
MTPAKPFQEGRRYLHILAKTLLEKETIEGDELRDIMAPGSQQASVPAMAEK